MKEMFKELWSEIPMKARYGLFFGIVFILCGIIWLTSCSTMKEAVKNYPQDNVLEELVEDVIESQTGLDLDLSPFSKEN